MAPSRRPAPTSTAAPAALLLLLCLAAAPGPATSAAGARTCPYGLLQPRQPQRAAGAGAGFEPLVEAKGWGDPRFKAFNGRSFGMCMKERGRHFCQGKVFNLLTEQHYQINVFMGRFQGPEQFPYNATWMTGLGFNYRDRKYGLESSVELRLKTDVEYQIKNDSTGKPRGVHPGGSPGGYRAVLSSLKVNGQNVAWRVETGKTQEMVGNMSVYFADGKHPHDPTDGPIVVIVTPDLRMTWYMETEFIWHLDFILQIRKGHQLQKVEGILGRTLPPHWDEHHPVALEHRAEPGYVVANGLLGSQFLHNLYMTHRPTK